MKIQIKHRFTGAILYEGEHDTMKGALLHCRAGYSVHLAGEAGYALEEALGTQSAGTAIYLASEGFVPHFFGDNGPALEDIRRRAEESAAYEASLESEEDR